MIKIFIILNFFKLNLNWFPTGLKKHLFYLNRFSLGFSEASPNPIVEFEETFFRRSRLESRGAARFGQNESDSGQRFGRFCLDFVSVLRAVKYLGDRVADDFAGTSHVHAVVAVHDALGNLKIQYMMLYYF